MERGREKKREKRVSENTLGLCLKGFYLFSEGGNFRGGLWGGPQQNIHWPSKYVLLGL